MVRAVRSTRVTRWFYWLVSPAFGREQRAVLAGKLRFNSDRKNPSETNSVLRRNTHRLEKGLISRPRRDVFALQYIEETVNVYQSVLESAKGECSGELSWAHDVLVEYFDTAGDHRLLNELGDRFRSLPPPSQQVSANRAESRKPYLRDLDEPVPVSYRNLLQLAERRRSVRWFTGTRVPREMLHQALAVATLAPSACNRQPFEFRIFDDPELSRKVADLPTGTVGYAHNFPCIVVVVGKLRYYYDEKDRHLIYIDGALASMSFVLALETLGLATCCINWPDIEEREQTAERLLQLEPDERPVMFIAVGYPDPTGLVPYSEKRTPRELCRFNFEERGITSDMTNPTDDALSGPVR